MNYRSIALLTAAIVALAGLLVLAPSLEAAKPEKEQKLLRHVVLFNFNDEASPEDIKKIEKSFRAMPSKVDVIHDFEWGTDVSVENLADGFTHCFLVTFKSEDDRAIYLPHPEHKKFIDLLGGKIEKVLVVDYWAGK